LIFRAAREVIEQAIAARAFPAASVEVGSATEIFWREAFGRLTFDAAAPAAQPDTIFDLASLTKVLATTPLLMQQVERGVLALDDAVATHVPTWRGTDRASATLRDLLAHCSGLPAWRPYYQRVEGALAYEAAICSEPFEYAWRTKSVYSDLGFMLLGFLLGRDGTSLDARFATLVRQLDFAEEIQFNPPALWRTRIAPTEDDSWRARVLVGEVHDENAWALGGVAGHAGLFGTAPAVGAFARHALQVLFGRTGIVARQTLETFVARDATVPGSSRALGWDTMLPTSSCGSRLSARAFGHTGFTGTSLWIDPERNLYVVLLTNRVYPTRTNDRIRQVRPAFHDAVVEGLT
jgi:CubicO group peptidase (beta-lactamase class C family)